MPAGGGGGHAFPPHPPPPASAPPLSIKHQAPPARITGAPRMGCVCWGPRGGRLSSGPTGSSAAAAATAAIVATPPPQPPRRWWSSPHPPPRGPVPSHEGVPSGAGVGAPAPASCSTEAAAGAGSSDFSGAVQPLPAHQCLPLYSFSPSPTVAVVGVFSVPRRTIERHRRDHPHHGT